MIIFFIFWLIVYATIYQMVFPLIENKQIDILEVFISLIKGHFHLWFIYIIIGLYLILPLLRLWVKDENKKYIEYLFAV